MSGCKQFYSESVFSEGIDRIAQLYRGGHRVVVSFSAGKDSGVCLELSKLAAEQEGCLPVEAVIRDEEIMFPGTYEYAERVRSDPKVKLHWIIAHQPIINVFNRECPYWWVFDPLLDPTEWVRQPPSFAEHIDRLNIENMADTKRFPPQEGKELIHIIGIRTQESRRRLWAISSVGGYVTKIRYKNERNAFPLYDWSDGDIWKAVYDNKWDYNKAYDAMHRLGMPRDRLRIAPPTMNVAGIQGLRIASRSFPQWFEKVCKRLPGVRAAVRWGRAVLTPKRATG